MTLALEKYPFTPGCAAPCRKSENAASTHSRGRFQTCGFEKRRREIAETDERIADKAALHATRPSHCERHARAAVVDVRLRAWKRHPVVCGNHDERVVELPERAQPFDNLAELPIEPLHFEKVIRQVSAYFRCIRQERRDAYGREIDTGCRARSFLIRPVRILAPEPERERPAGRAAT